MPGIEAAGAYGAYRHGEAVGLGLLVALRLSERDAASTPVSGPRSSSSCSATACPRRLAGSRLTRSSLAALDKKRRGRRHRLVLLQSPGKVITDYRVSEDSLGEAIEEIRGVEVRS